MYKYILLILLILTNRSQTEAQISTNASGNDIYSQYGVVSYSVGELFYTQKGSELTSSEGLQNGASIHSSHHKSLIKIAIYPNPTVDLVYFKFQNSTVNNLSYKIYNETGNVLIQGTITNANTSVSLGQLPSSVYVCKVFKEQAELTSLKIIKIN